MGTTDVAIIFLVHLETNYLIGDVVSAIISPVGLLIEHTHTLTLTHTTSPIRFYQDVGYDCIFQWFPIGSKSVSQCIRKSLNGNLIYFLHCYEVMRLHYGDNKVYNKIAKHRASVLVCVCRKQAYWYSFCALGFVSVFILFGGKNKSYGNERA